MVRFIKNALHQTFGRVSSFLHSKCEFIMNGSQKQLWQESPCLWIFQCLPWNMFPSLPTLLYVQDSAQTRYSIIIDWPMKGNYLMHHDHLCQGPTGISLIPEPPFFSPHFEKGTDSGLSWVPCGSREYEKKYEGSINVGSQDRKEWENKERKHKIRSKQIKPIKNLEFFLILKGTLI